MPKIRKVKRRRHCLEIHYRKAEKVKCDALERLTYEKSRGKE